MRVPFLIIDGYNLLHAAGMARLRYGPGDLERARHHLIQYLVRHLTPAERARTTVVFDARESPPHVPPYSHVEGMEIVFAGSGGDADAEIEQTLAAHSAPRQVLVVSSDHRLQRAAQRRRARAVDSERFHDDLQRRGPQSPPGRAAEPPATAPARDPKRIAPSDEETAYWLEEFGEVPGAADLERQREQFDSRHDTWRGLLDELADELPDDEGPSGRSR